MKYKYKFQTSYRSQINFFTETITELAVRKAQAKINFSLKSTHYYPRLALIARLKFLHI